MLAKVWRQSSNNTGKVLNKWQKENEHPTPRPNLLTLAKIYSIHSVRQKEGDEKEKKQHLKFQNVS